VPAQAHSGAARRPQIGRARFDDGLVFWGNLIAAALSAIAAIASAIAAVKLLGISNRTADSTDRAAQAELASAEATEALRKIEVERGHGDLAPRVHLEWYEAASPARIAIRMTNECWRGYRATKIELHRASGRTLLSVGEDVPSRGHAGFYPFPNTTGLKPSDIKERVAELAADAMVEITWASDGLWSCGCERPADAHWVERRQLPSDLSSVWYSLAN
jgi:hypothetical protein